MTIKQAVEIIENESKCTVGEFGDAVCILKNLGKAYIEIKGLPEEKKVDMRIAGWGEKYTREVSFNQALHLCKLAVMKEYVRKDKIEVDVKKIREIIDGHIEYAILSAERDELAKALAQADIIKVKERR